MPENLKIIPLGGLGAIGKNITLIEYNNQIIIIDCGIMFPRDDMPGIDFIIPDFSYLRENKEKIKAIIITHGHEDHIGAIPFLVEEFKAPIYATKLTIGLIQSRLAEKQLVEYPMFIEVVPRQIVEINSFAIEFIRVNHSITDSVGLAIKTPIGTIIHSGDFKIDFSPVDGDVTDLYSFAKYGEEGVLLLLSDSTNAEKDGFTKSESALQERMIDIFSNSKNRIIVATFASNIHRIQQICDVAQIFHRNVVVTGLSMLKNIEISRELGYLNIKEEIFVTIDQARNLPNKKLVINGTGTQGEPMSALSRMSNGTHRHFTVEKGDAIIITASVIPGNERLVTNVVNSLMEIGADVYYDRSEGIHVSGHGSAKELKMMLTLTKPEFFMPVHGEYKHLKAHSNIAESLNIKPSHIVIAHNGDILELTKKHFKKIDSIDLSNIYVDGSETGDADSTIIRDRQVMSLDGIVMITIVISKNKLQQDPQILMRGFHSESSSNTIDVIKNDIKERMDRFLKDTAPIEKIEPALQKGLKNLIFKLCRRNPLITIQILEIL
jgi:ribonuclease J